MTKQYIALALGLALAGPASASILTVDWPGGGTASADGSVYIHGNNLNTAQSKYLTGLHFSLDGTSTFGGSSSTQLDVGVYNFNINSTATNLLCVELTQNSGDAVYDYKNLSGLAGWLTQQMGSVSDNNHGAALALATWKIAYDSKQYNGFSAAGLNLGTGRFRYTTSGTILNLANNYLSGFAANNQNLGYVYYRNPVGGGTECGYQDFIGLGYGSTGNNPTPAPLAVVPFLAGFLRALLKKKR